MNEQRQKFLNELSRNGELRNLNTAKVVNFNEYKRNNERYTSQTTRTQTRRRVRNRRKNKALKKLAKLGIIGGAGLLAFGSITALRNHSNTLTIQEAMQEGKTLEEMGLTLETYEELEKINEMMQNSDSLTREQILELGEDLQNNELSVIKDKIRNALNTEEAIRVNSRGSEGVTSIDVGNKTLIENDGFAGDYGKGIGDYIENIADLQTNNSLYEEELLDSQEMIEVLEKSLDKTNIFAAADLTESKDGKLKLENATAENIQKQPSKKDVELDEER